MINISRIRNSARGVAAGAALLTVSAGMIVGAAPPAHAQPAAPAALTGDIRFGVNPIADHSAGHSYADLTYTNISSHPVEINGYAGVSVVAHHDGTQVGRPAVWLQNRRPVSVILQPGEQTTEIVSIADASAYGSTASSVRADGFRIYLPGSRAAAFVPYVFTATTRDVAQLQVDPIGARI